MKGWERFLADSPDRLERLIEEGPMSLTEYKRDVSHKALNWSDKRRGVLSFKGGTGRGTKTSGRKPSGKAVVYFDPYFCVGEDTPLAVPDEVVDRHSEEEKIAAFKEM
jgi:hypothetical protein